MKRTRTLLMISTILFAGMFGLAATPNAEKQYADIQAMEVSSQSLETLKSSYDKLNQAVSKEATEARKDLASAWSKGDSQAYWKAYQTLDTLSSYTMSRQQSDALLQQILTLDEPKKAEYGAWLYQNSPYYRPILTLDFSATGDTYQYRYQQSISKEPGSEVTLPDESQLRMNSHDLGILSGWGLTPDAVTYQPGQTIKMSYTDQTLYAIYTSGVRFVDSQSKTNVLFTDGQKVEVPTPVSENPAAIFAGWYDRSTGTLITDPASYTPEGKGASFEALWKSLSIENPSVLYYQASKLPTNTQIGVGFAYTNTGNVNLNGLTAALSTDSKDVRMLQDSLQLGRLSAGLSSTNNSPYATDQKQTVQGEANTFRFVVNDGTASGTVIPFTLTITNDTGDRWTQQFECVVQ
ncbi:hypothetical protein [Sphaerochaeta sp.]|uniref:hypothetical protein n=1 Tax=Sphaerochaeta sp. TaxID=1972642 RepID=UPI002FCBE9B1